MTHIFDGRTFAREKESELTRLTGKLNKKGITPKLISIIVGNDPASELYVNLKRKAGERVGCEVVIRSLSEKSDREEIVNEIEKYNQDESVHGIMVQLPLPKKFSKSDREMIINTIDLSKDVDGLQGKSRYITPTAKAVFYVLNEAINIVRHINKKDLNVVVVGLKGFEGQKIIKTLKSKNFKVSGVDVDTRNKTSVIKSADVIVSATGVPNLVKNKMVKSGVILVDVGSPKGDIEKEAYEKASFVSPVPGGVGPITISCLMENLINASDGTFGG